jgi:hypothetical protein
MPNYKNGKVYKLVNNIDNLIYIGSTTCRLSTRMALHRDRAKKNYNANIYKHMRKIGVDNFKIVLFEYCSCNSKDELLRRERYIFDIHDKNILLNSNRPSTTYVEKKHDNKKNYKIWYNNNREYKIKQVMNRYLKYRSYLITYQQKYKEHQKIMKELPFYKVKCFVSF